MRIYHTLPPALALIILISTASLVKAQTATLFDTVKPDLGVNLNYKGASLSSGAGPFDTTISGMSGVASSTHFDTYCVDLNHYLQSTQTVTPESAVLTLPNGTQLAYLYNTFAPGVSGDLVKGAALQLALWEVASDYNAASTLSTKGLDLSGGNFKFTGMFKNSQVDYTPYYTSVLSQANSDLASLLSAGTYQGDATYFDAVHVGNTGQSLIGPSFGHWNTSGGASAVPEPGAISLATSTLIGMSVFAVRRRRK
jgi:hypothetical protein